MSDDHDTTDGGAPPEAGQPAPSAGDPAPKRRRGGWRRIALRTGLGAIALFVLIQLIPFGRAHDNPPVTKQPAWDSARTQVLFSRACADCHSNETTWPWYSNVAPVSWLVTNDVDGGRGTFNVSEWDRPQDDVGDVAEVIQSGEMPPFYYTWMHSSAKLSSAEKQQLIAGWQATMAASPPIGGGG